METSRKQISENGEDKLASCMDQLHASRSALQEKEEAIAMTVGSGEKCLEQYGKYSPLGLLSRMLLTSRTWFHPLRNLVWKKEYVMKEKRDFFIASSKISKQKVIKSRHSLFQLVPLERHTSENESGLSGILPSPVASDAGAGSVIGKNDQFIQNSNGNWRKINQNGVNGSVGLARMAKMGILPTPIASSWKVGKPTERIDGPSRKSQLNFLVCQETGKCSQLNPLFVEEMMGFPKEWLLEPFLNGENRP